MRIRLLTWMIGFVLLGTALYAVSVVYSSLPWIEKAIVESTFNNRTAYHLIFGDRGADLGDEHVLIDEGGKEICRFGGFVGHVTAGACDLDKITYVRTVYPQN